MKGWASEADKFAARNRRLAARWGPREFDLWQSVAPILSFDGFGTASCSLVWQVRLPNIARALRETLDAPR